MTRNAAIIPIVGTAVLYILAQGWLEKLWQTIWVSANTGGGGPTTQNAPNVVGGAANPLYSAPPGSWNAQHPNAPIPGGLGSGQLAP